MYPVICSWCKKIVKYSNEVDNSHTCCEECKEKLFNQLEKDLEEMK